MLNKQHTDRHHIQPTTTPFSPLNETIHFQVINTPNQNSTPFQQSNYPKTNFPDELSDGGVPICSSDIPYSPFHTTPNPNPKVPLFPKRVANSAVRRTQQASTLVSSPPRPGHSSCMRQIFSVSSIGRSQQGLPQDDGRVSYPVLPNLSQTPSPAKQEGQAFQPGNKDIPPLPTPEADSAVPESKHQRAPTRSSTSSESWSGDSGYFIPGAATQICPPVRASTPNSQTHIDEWLSSVSPEDGLCQVDGPVEYSSQEYSTANSTPNEIVSMPINRHADRTPQHERVKLARQPLLNAYQKSNIPSKIPLLTSNPLSLNVCVDRGSSRSQSSRTLRDPELPPDTPTKRTRRAGLGVLRQASSVPATQVNPSKRFEGKENSAGQNDTANTYEWHASGSTAGRAQFWKSPLSSRGGPARATMRGAGTPRRMH